MTMTEDSSLRARLAKAIGGFAPTLAGALGGPLAGAAVAAVSKAVTGEESAPAGAILEAVIGRDPKALAALRTAELDFRKAVLEAQNESRRIAASDRADAREREKVLKDVTPALLGFGVIGGFFFVMASMLWRELPAEADTEFSILLGALATMTAAVVNYYFGSSADSAEKTRVMGGLR
ncbi:MAG: hypothetical protein AAGA69_04195 [Pseudomonadota bacterium]